MEIRGRGSDRRHLKLHGRSLKSKRTRNDTYEDKKKNANCQCQHISPPPLSTAMKWGLVVSLLLPYVAATLPPYKRFVSPRRPWSPCRLKTHADDARNPARITSPGVLVQAPPTTASSVVISKFPSTGQRTPLEKRGSPSPSMLPRNHPGRASSLPTQVCPLLSFPRERSPLTRPTGGPGGSGVDLILGYGPLMSNLTGGYYDIVSWDPRGVGYTT